MIDEDKRPWWDAWTLCNGFTKNGKRCNKPIAKAWEIEPGNLFIPLTCIFAFGPTRKS